MPDTGLEPHPIAVGQCRKPSHGVGKHCIKGALLDVSLPIPQAAVYFADNYFGLGTTMPSCMRVTAMSTRVSFTGVSCSPSSCAACQIHASQRCFAQTANTDIAHHSPGMLDFTGNKPELAKGVLLCTVLQSLNTRTSSQSACAMLLSQSHIRHVCPCKHMM